MFESCNALCSSKRLSNRVKLIPAKSNILQRIIVVYIAFDKS
nr:MAG TPA: hypothetical protein [Bacteriophage sp.]DAH37783.1 MAG TPA: hypothetical protein [Caudoviricetes sp.]